MITQKRLKELLHFDAKTGVFTQRVSKGRVKAGEAVGSRNRCLGYTEVWADRKKYYAHRLAWFYVYGRWPDDQIDHVNCIKDDNCIANLREATNSENHQNMRKPHSDGTSGYLGVTYHKQAKKWTAHIWAGGKQNYLGLYNCPTAAYYTGYLPAKRRLHTFGTL